MSRILFKVGNTDMTGNILIDSYTVYNQPIYKEYEDANGETHKRYIRNKIKGSFDMFFEDINGYTSFITLLTNNTDNSNYSTSVTVYDTLRLGNYTINAFIDFKPTLTLNPAWNEYIKKFTVNVEEK